MVSQVTLGNFFTANGKTVLGGVGGSGLDTEALITSLTDAKALPATQLQDIIDLNDKKQTALTDFQNLLSAFEAAANVLRNPPGVDNAADDGFRYNTASITSNTSVAGSTYMSINAQPGAAIQNYTINQIQSLAAAKIQSTGNISIATADTAAVSATPAAGEFGAGTFTLNGQNITLVVGDSLNTVASKFNAVSDATGIRANIFKVADGTYRLSFVATETGTANDFDFNDAGTLTDASGVFTQITVSDSQTASDAVLTINGIPITRSTNTIDDIVDNVTFTLLQTTPALTTLNVDISADTQTARNSIINFANAYNDIRTFFAEQTKLKADGTFDDTALLAGNQTFRSIVSSITSYVTSIVSGIDSSDPSRLADIGASFITIPATTDEPEVTNVLNIDDSQLTSALATNFEGVTNLFGFNFVSDNADLTVFSRTNALAVTSFSLNIDPGTSTFQATYDDGTGSVTVDLTATAITGSTGYTLAGPAGSALEGLMLIYASNSAAAINVTVTQGIADKIYNTTKDALTSTTGSLALEQDSIKDSDTRLTDQITKINDQVDAFREQLLQKFGALEQAISLVNTLLQSLDAADKARIAGSS